MTDKGFMKHINQVNKLCFSGEKVIESESFRDLTYMVKDGHIVLMSKKCGKFAISFEVLPELIKELEEMRETWGNIKTKKCLL